MTKKIKVAMSHLTPDSLHIGRGIGFYTENLLVALRDSGEVDILPIEDFKKADVIHYTFFDFFKHTLKVDKNIPTIVTIHDITPLIFPQHYPAGIRGSLKLWLQKRELRRAAAIITDSFSSKRGIERYLQVKADKIYPIYLAPSSNFKRVKEKTKLKNLKDKYNLPDRFLLYVGNINWNKNIPNLVKAAIDANTDIFLVGKGFEMKDHLDHAELRSYKLFLDRLSDNNLVHTLGFVTTEDLVVLYSLATIVLIPSFYEGFGLPILEAQACGTAVITSNISSLPEVAGKGAYFVDPHNSQEIQQAITRLLKNHLLRRQLINFGLENVKKFSWSKCARETIAVYKKVRKLSL